MLQTTPTSGGANFTSEAISPGPGCPCLKVEDSLAAYQQLALWHRAQFPQARILAITGSCGKTSTKEMCAAILEEHFPVRQFSLDGDEELSWRKGAAVVGEPFDSRIH